MNQKLNLNSILGYSDTETVKLDFDNTSFKTVRFWAFRTMQWHKLEGLVIFKSSKNSYHIVFNRKVSWKKNMKIVAWVSLLSHNLKLLKWFVMQCIKESSTLRVSPKKQKPSPRIVFRYGKQEKQIQTFLQYRRLVKNIMRKMHARIDR